MSKKIIFGMMLLFVALSAQAQEVKIKMLNTTPKSMVIVSNAKRELKKPLIL